MLRHCDENTVNRLWFNLGVLFTVCLCAPSARAADVEFTGSIRPMLEKHCLDCHDAESKKGGTRPVGVQRRSGGPSPAEPLGKCVREGRIPPDAAAETGIAADGE